MFTIESFLMYELRYLQQHVWYIKAEYLHLLSKHKYYQHYVSRCSVEVSNGSDQLQI